MTTPHDIARILLSDLGTAAAGIEYAERIARNAERNAFADPATAPAYRDAAQILREREPKT